MTLAPTRTLGLLLGGLPGEALEIEGVRFVLTDRLPYESTDPGKPGMIHALRSPQLFGSPCVLVSRLLFDTFRRRIFRLRARAWFRRAVR